MSDDQPKPSQGTPLKPVPEGSLHTPSPRRVQIPLLTSEPRDGDDTTGGHEGTVTSSSSSRRWGRASPSSLPARLRRKVGSTVVKPPDEPELDGILRADEGEEQERQSGSRSTVWSEDKTLTQYAAPPPTNTSPPTNSLPEPDDQASNLIMGAVGRRPASPTPQPLPSSTSRIGGLSGFGAKSSSSGPASPLIPAISPDQALAPPRATLIEPSKPVGGSSTNSGRSYRPPSPFFRARRSRDKTRARDTSPEVGALAKDTSVESDGESVSGSKRFRPQVSAYEDADDSGTEVESNPAELEDESEGEDVADLGAEEDDMMFDEETEKNTEANAVFYEGDAAGLGGQSAGLVAEERLEDDRDVLDTFGEEVEQDPLGEGPNIVVPPPPLFPTASTHQHHQRKSPKSGLDLVTSRPVYARDRCTITLTHGSPDGALEGSGKRMRRYVVLSDLSEESRYAVDWAIGTVARDGDEIFLISVKEDESKGA